MTARLFFLCSILLSFQVAARAHGGSIKGLVVDASTNIELAGARVELAGQGAMAITNDLGQFSFGGLAAGPYTLRVSYVGFKPLELTVVVVDHESVEVKFSLEYVVIELSDVQIITRPDRPLSSLSQIDIQSRPIQSAQDILRQVPGLFIAQHAGGGKAEQIFLRGFDLDHGTDIALSADGIPVNMVSHAHGQGYADLHFLIPELIERVDFRKGPYYASVGNLNTAGYVRFETPERLRQSFVMMEAGQYETFRTVAAVDLLGARAESRGTGAYVAAEGLFSNGFFDAPQGFKRLNVFGKFRQAYEGNKILTVSGSHFTSDWLASGQIPERAVLSGRIGHFGAIDSTEGGRTSRSNLNLEHAVSLGSGAVVKNQLYYSRYQFELYSNFTFFLDDPVNGDQIRQREFRNLFGYHGSVQQQGAIGSVPVDWVAGFQVRYDDIRDIELSETLNRVTTLSTTRLGDIGEVNTAQYAEATLGFNRLFSMAAGLRYDQFYFSYYDKVNVDRAFRQKSRSILSPKLNLTWQLNDNWSLYGQAGTGFHSNDTRVILGAGNENTLPRAIGYEAGSVFKPFPAMMIAAGVWFLDLEQELVYVGDEGVVEPSGQTRRRGVDLSVRWNILPWLLLDADYNYTHPRAISEPEGADHIPLAPLQSSIGGLTVRRKAWSASLRYRWLADRPANEDYSLTATGYFLTDATLSWQPGSHLEVRLSAQNLGNVEWREAQFETETRLADEIDPVNEIHYTPGTPFFGKCAVVLKF